MECHFSYLKLNSYSFPALDIFLSNELSAAFEHLDHIVYHNKHGLYFFIFCCCCSIKFLLKRHTVCGDLWIIHLLRAFFFFRGTPTLVLLRLGSDNHSSWEERRLLSPSWVLMLQELWLRQLCLLEKYMHVFHMDNILLEQFQLAYINRDGQAKSGWDPFAWPVSVRECWPCTVSHQGMPSPAQLNIWFPKRGGYCLVLKHYFLHTRKSSLCGCFA